MTTYGAWLLRQTWYRALKERQLRRVAQCWCGETFESSEDLLEHWVEKMRRFDEDEP